MDLMGKQNFTKMLLCDGTPELSILILRTNIINRVAKIAVLRCSLTSVKGNNLLFTSIHSIYLSQDSLSTNSLPDTCVRGSRVSEQVRRGGRQKLCRKGTEVHMWGASDWALGQAGHTEWAMQAWHFPVTLVLSFFRDLWSEFFMSLGFCIFK